MEKRCSFCNAKLEIEDKVGRGDVCPSCRRDLRSCIQCRFYNQSSYNQCEEPQAERVVDKEKANFCDYFEFGGRGCGANDKKEKLSKLEGLFKKT